MLKKSSHLRRRIFLSITPIVIFAILTLSLSNILLFKSVHSVYRELLEEKMFAIAKNIRRVINKNLVVFPLNSFNWLSTYLNGVVENNDDLSYCFIADKSKVILYHNDETKISTLLNENLYANLFSKKDFSRLTLSAGYYYELIVPVVKSDEMLGTIHLGIQKALIDSKISDMILVSAIVLAVSLIISIVLAAFISDFVASKVNVIKNGIKNIKQELTHTIPTMQGELGEIAAAINEMALDLAERKNLEAQMQRADRLAAVGEIAAGVAHEIRNPLTCIKGFVQLIEEDLHSDDDKLAYTKIIIEEADRLNRIICELLYYARPSDTSRTLVDINSIIDNALVLLNFKISKPMIQVHKKYSDNLPAILADEEQVKQLFLNLIINSLQAIDAEGEINITTDLCTDHKFVRVMIHDTGKGIEKRDLKRLFDPFYTTKEEGTGLGLAVAQRVVELHGGHIEIESQAGQGTTFTVYIPTEAECRRQASALDTT